MNGKPRLGITKECPSCLKPVETEEQFELKLTLYLKSLPAELKTPDDEYIRRLAVCSACPELVNGVCMSCGCYPKMRAAVRNKFCPRLGDTW